MMKAGGGLVIALMFSSAAWAQTPPTPSIPVNLNNRTFLDSADVYDPTYGLGRVGIVTDKVVNFLPFRLVKELPPPGKLISRNFQVYSFNSEEGKSGNLSIPVIGGFSASGTDILHILMEDVSEIFLDKGFRPTVCELWNSINHSLVDPGSTIIFTDHAVFSTMSYGAASKSDANAKIGIGSYFSAGASIYKSADNATKIPLISVDGVKFKVADPKTFCTRRGDRLNEIFTDFRTIQDLGLAPGATVKTLDAVQQ